MVASKVVSIVSCHVVLTPIAAPFSAIAWVYAFTSVSKSLLSYAYFLFLF